jgi:serine/threonine-protein kinase
VRHVHRVLLVAFAAGLVSTLVVWRITRPAVPPPSPPVRLTLGLPKDVRVRELALSPDGTQLAYTAELDGPPQLYLRSLARFDSVSLDGTTGAHTPFFSPDGRWLAFFADGKLRKVPVQGGGVQDVCDAPIDSAGGTWGADDQIVFAPLDGRGLVKVPATGGMLQTFTKIDTPAGEIAHGWPHLLPRQTGLVFTIARKNRDPRIAVVGPNDTAPRLLLPVNGPVHYESSGRLVYSFSGQLFALQFDLATLRGQGTFAPIARDVAGSPRGFDALGFSMFTVSLNGVLAYLPGTQDDPANHLVWVDRNGKSISLSDVAAPHQTPRLSPDGARVAVVARDGPFSRDIWIEDVASHRRRKLTTEGSANHSPVWSPDGRELAFASNRSGSQNLYVQKMTPAHAGVRPLSSGDGTYNPTSWPQRATFAFYEVSPATGRDIWLRLEDGRQRPLVVTPANERSPVLSPDGQWLAYTSDASGTDEIYVESIADQKTERVSAGGGTEPMWSRDGRELFYRRADQMMVVPILTSPSFRAAPAMRLFERAYERDPGDNLANYDVAPDGRHFLMLQRTDLPSDVRIILNWGR